MSKFKLFISKIKHKLFIALKRYPIALALLFAATIMFMITINITTNDKSIDEEIFIRLAMSFIYGALLSLIVKSLAERFDFKKSLEWLLYISVPIACLLVFFFLVPDFDSTIKMLQYALLCVLTASLFFYVPTIADSRSASYFAQKVLLRLAITMIYFGIIVGGVEAILFAIENLLSIDLPDEIYSQVAVLIAGVFIPSFFFAGIPTKDDKQESFPKLLKLLLHYIVYTLLSAYTLVLYLYFIKILFELELPSNLLGSLVIYYSIISIAALYFGRFTKDENKWTTTFHKVFPFAVILPTLMMLLSFIVRIGQYGFTEPRYYAILCVIFVLASISIIKLTKKVKLIPLIISILLLVSIFGPISSFNISKWSQNNRFSAVLTEANMLDGGKITPNPDADEDTKHELTQIINYFDSRQSFDDLNYINSDFETADMEDIFGFDLYYMKKSVERYFINSPHERYQIIDIADYDYLADVHPYADDIPLDVDNNDIVIKTLQEAPYTLTVSINEKEIYSIDMLDMMMPYFKDASTRSEDSYDYIFTDETDLISVKMIIMNAHYEDNEYFYYDIKLLFSLK